VSREDKDRTILVVSQQGFGKKTAIDEYRVTNRGGKGVKTINVTEKTGSLVGLMDVLDSDDLMITCKSGVTIRTSINEIREAGRATQGVKLIRLDEGDEIAATSIIRDQGDDEEEDDATASSDVEGNSSSDVEGNSSSDVEGSSTSESSTDDTIDNTGDNTPVE
jgi:DNA gyrase subunit A